MTDLFEHYESLPNNILKIMSKYEDQDTTYKTCESMLKEMEAEGYTFDYSLDASPFNLTKINKTDNH